MLPIKGFKETFVAVSVGMAAITAPVFAIPYAPGVVYHPIHYKPGVSSLVPSGLTPAKMRKAYGFDAIAAQGKGQVIAIVDAYDDPNIESDLAVFSKQFGLPACTTKNGCFKKIYANNHKPRTNAGWAGEIALDVEWAHAMAPQAKIILVEAATASFNDMFHAIQVAVAKGATVVSMSWGAPEFAEEMYFDGIFANPAVTFTASSGDSGTGTIYPAASPHVLAVGGTTLRVDAQGNYLGESAWSGSGGGVSEVESWPLPQSNLPIPASGGYRGVPDVAYNADPYTGVAVYNTVRGAGPVGWMVVGGTSAGAPQWAAMVAVANSYKHSNVGGHLQSLLYAAAVPNSNTYHAYFNDIISGTNGSCGYYCTAIVNYDYVTGLGSPKVASLIPGLFSPTLME